MSESSQPPPKTPKYDLQTYRNFIREAAAYITIVAGRKVSAKDADTMSDQQLTELALVIDSRVSDLNKNRPPWYGGGDKK